MVRSGRKKLFGGGKNSLPFCNLHVDIVLTGQSYVNGLRNSETGVRVRSVFYPCLAVFGAQLPECLVKDHGYGICQVDRANPGDHGNRDRPVPYSIEESRGESSRFRAENQISVPGESYLCKRTVRFRGNEEKCGRSGFPVQCVDTLVVFPAEMFPIVEAGSLQVAILKGKTELSNEVKACAGGNAQPADASGVLGYLGFNEDDVKALRPSTKGSRHGFLP